MIPSLEDVYERVVAKYEAVYIYINKDELRAVLEQMMQPKFIEMIEQGASVEEEKEELEAKLTELLTKQATKGKHGYRGGKEE